MHVCMQKMQTMQKKKIKLGAIPHPHPAPKKTNWLAIVRSVKYPRPCATFAGKQAELCKRTVVYLVKTKKEGFFLFGVGGKEFRSPSSALSFPPSAMGTKRHVYCTFAIFKEQMAT